MSVYSLWILICICGNGVTVEDLDRCILNGNKDLSVFRHDYCVPTQNDVTLMCPPNNIIAVSSLQFVIKRGNYLCTKRVLSSGNSFCCIQQDVDVRYDGNCLVEAWSPEDKQHYRHFMQNALATCKSSSRCVLKSELFGTLQRNVPSTSYYSSYFQVVYRCITERTNVVKACSSKSITGKQIHIQRDATSKAISTKPCACHVSSLDDDNVTIKAVDVRTKSSELILKSNSYVKEHSSDEMPLFGYKEIFSDNELDIFVKQGSVNDRGNIWLHVSGAKDGDVNVTCEEIQPDATTTEKTIEETTTETAVGIQAVGGIVERKPTTRTKTPSVDFSSERKQEEHEELWPIIYASAGAFLTLIPIFGIVCCVLICRLGSKQQTRRKEYRDPGPYRVYRNPGEYLQPQPHINRESAIYDTLKSRISRMNEDAQSRTNDPGLMNVQPLLTDPKPIVSSQNNSRNETASSSLLSTTVGSPYDVTEVVSFQDNRWDRQPQNSQIEGANSHAYQNQQNGLDSDYCEDYQEYLQPANPADSRSYFVLQGGGH